MKVYVLMERTFIDSEEYETIIGIFSSLEKANEAMDKFKQSALENDEYEVLEYELDKNIFQIEVE